MRTTRPRNHGYEPTQEDFILDCVRKHKKLTGRTTTSGYDHTQSNITLDYVRKHEKLNGQTARKTPQMTIDIMARESLKQNLSKYSITVLEYYRELRI